VFFVKKMIFLVFIFKKNISDTGKKAFNPDFNVNFFFCSAHSKQGECVIANDEKTD